MDLAAFKIEEISAQGRVMELRHPATDEVLRDDNGEAITIRLLGKDSARFRNKARDINERRMSRMQKTGKAAVLSDDDSCELLAACTVGWAGIVEDGVELKFSDKEAARVYLEHPWIREQVDAFIGDRGNFL